MAFGDSSTANPINPQGTVGGGNVFNAAPLFGSSTISDSGSSGSDGASTTSEDTAAMGGPASGVIGDAGVAAAASSFWDDYGSYVLIALAIASGVGLIFLIKHFRRKK